MPSRGPSPEQPNHSDPDPFGAVACLSFALDFALFGPAGPASDTLTDKKTPCGARSLTEWSQADPNPLPCSGFVGLLHFVLHQNLHQVLLGVAVPSTQARRADAADLNILPRRIRFFLSSSFLAGDGGLGLWLACQ